LAGCSAVWASKATAPGRPPGVLFYFLGNNLPVQTKNVLAFKCVLSVLINYLFKSGRNHGYL
jgi:hypothetical protein